VHLSGKVGSVLLVFDRERHEEGPLCSCSESSPCSFSFFPLCLSGFFPLSFTFSCFVWGWFPLFDAR
jgi:hypothetical protein